MARRSFDEALKMGRTGEYTIASELEARGWFVIPSYNYTGKDGDKAQKMKRGSTTYVVPDLDVCKEGCRNWVEVKTKSEPTLYRKTNQLVHGIDKRHWKAYLDVQKESGCDVFLCILEMSTGEALIAPIDHLASIARHGVGKGRGMVYFPRTAFFRAFQTHTANMQRKKGAA